MDTSRIGAHRLFAGIPEEELVAIARVASEREFASGEIVTTERDFGHSLFLVESGSADVSIGGETVGEVGPGDIVGEVAVMASGRRTASVAATSPMQVIALFKRDVWALEREAPEAAARLRTAIDARTSRPDPPA